MDLDLRLLMQRSVSSCYSSKQIIKIGNDEDNEENFCEKQVYISSLIRNKQ